MRAGNLKVMGLAISAVLATLCLAACGSDPAGPTTTRAALSAATAGHLAKLSDRVASDLGDGNTCDAAHAADDLQSAVEDATLPDSIRSGVDEVAGRLVDEVNCPPPPPPPPTTTEEKKPKKDHQDQGGHKHKPPGHGGKLPPGQAKLKGEEQ
jgi:hypothetical protein